MLGLYLPFLNVYFQQLGLNGWEIGLLSTLSPAATLLLAPPLGMVADRRGWRIPMLAGGILLGAVALFLLPRSHSFLAVALFMGLYAVSYSPLTPLADSLLAGLALRHRLNYGDMRLWGSIAFAIAAIAGGAVWQRSGYALMFSVAALGYLVVILVALQLSRTTVAVRRQGISFGTVLHDRFLLVLLAGTFFAAIAIGIDGTFSGVYMKQLGGGSVLVGLLFGLSALCEPPTMRFSGHIRQRLGASGMLLLAYGLYGAAFLGYALALHPWMLLIFGMVKGLAFGLFYAGTVRVISEHAPSEWATTLQGVMTAVAFGLARLIAGPLGGRIYDAFGGNVMYGSCVVCVMVAISLVAAASRAGSVRQAAAARRGSLT